jgi:hypothetical protein
MYINDFHLSCFLQQSSDPAADPDSTSLTSRADATAEQDLYTPVQPIPVSTKWGAYGAIFKAFYGGQGFNSCLI